MEQTTYVNKFFGLYKNNAVLTHMSDNERMLRQFASDNDRIIEIDTSVYEVPGDPVDDDINNVKYINLIENQHDGYGISEIYSKPDSKEITMFQHIINKKQDNYDLALSELTEEQGRYEDYKTAYDCVVAHNTFWCRTTPEERPRVYHMNNKMLNMLLSTGFEANVLLIAT